MKKDDIEQTQEFIDAMKKIQPQLNELNERLETEGIRMGRCHRYWNGKKELLKKVGIDWKTPDECNPHIHFD